MPDRKILCEMPYWSVLLKRAIKQFAFTAITTPAHALPVITRAMRITVHDSLPEPCVINGGAVQSKLDGVIINGNGCAINRQCVAR